MNNIKDLSPDSKIWVYQCNREFSEAEVLDISQKAEFFLESWDSHGNALSATIEIFYNRFIVIAVDEKQALSSGCAIDKSISFIKNIEAFYAVSLMDRMLVTYKQKGTLHACKLKEFEQLLAQGTINADTIVFNNMVTTIDEFSRNWETPVKNSWHSRMVKG